MENYTKGKNIEEALERDKLPFKNLPPDFLWMQVKGGSKMRNLLKHAVSVFNDKMTKAVVWSGIGPGLSKTISCVEIMKRQLGISNQITKICYQKVEEYWEPKVDGLETIVVNRQIPVIHILLSLDQLDCNELGFQSENSKKFWNGEKSSSKKEKIMYGKRKNNKGKNGNKPT